MQTSYLYFKQVQLKKLFKDMNIKQLIAGIALVTLRCVTNGELQLFIVSTPVHSNNIGFLIEQVINNLSAIFSKGRWCDTLPYIPKY